MKALIRNALASVFLFAPTAALASGPDVFKAQNCDSCHSVTKAGIPLSATPDEKSKDLSDIGTRYDKKFLAGFLLKKNEIDGVKHKKGFTGKTEELRELATWLETLK